ncbi:zinc-ribbon domain containing protein [Thermoclostridium stercorarium]
MKETREIGRIAAISVKCKTCGKVFAMNRREILWYSNMGFPLPKRCPECRAKRRKEREKNEKKIKNAHASQSE